MREFNVAFVVLICFINAMQSRDSAADVTMNFYHPSVYNGDTQQLDAAVGVTGYSIEDFEDVELIPSLSIALSLIHI